MRAGGEGAVRGGAYAPGMVDLSQFQSILRRGDLVIAVDDGLAQAHHAPTSSTLGVFDIAQGTGWTRDDRDFDDVGAWKAHVESLSRRSWG